MSDGVRSLAVAGLAVSLALFAAGCGDGRDSGAAPAAGSSSGGPTKVKLAYLGLTCEAAMFVAQEKGFFREEGIEVEFVKTDWDGLRDGLGLGKFDANYTLVMYLLKPIEQGLDVKITGGVHSGCLRTQVPEGSPAKSLADLKGKTIGIPNMGSPPFLFTSRALAAQGLDPRTDVNWVVVAPEIMKIALEKGQVDAVANSEPMGSILTAQAKIRTIADQAVDEPYRDEYCCATVVSKKFAESDPSGAAKITRALLKGALWVDVNPQAAAEISVAKKYVASSAELNGMALAKLKFMPSVSRCRESIGQAARDMKAAGLLNAGTDPAQLAERAWLELDGVTDEWIRGLEVEKIAGGEAPDLDDARIAELAGRESDLHALLCVGCGAALDSDLCGR